MLEITYKVKNIIIFYCILLLAATISINSTMASEWYEEDTLYEATFRQWKVATYNNKVATCAGFILATVNDGYLLLDNKDTLLNTQDTTLLKTLAEILANTTDAFISNSANLDDAVSGAVLLAMLELGWIKPDYLIFLAEKAQAQLLSRTNETLPTPTPKHNEERSNIKNLPINEASTQKVKVRKYRLMSPEAGRKWVKKNIIPSMVFAKDELVERLGNYEKATSTLSNNKTLDKYYFKRINITFLVIQDNQTIIGFTDGKGFRR